MKNHERTVKALPEPYNCGPVKLSGEADAFYERHVTFDHVVPHTETSDQFSSDRTIAEYAREIWSAKPCWTE